MLLSMENKYNEKSPKKKKVLEELKNIKIKNIIALNEQMGMRIQSKYKIFLIIDHRLFQIQN